MSKVISKRNLATTVRKQNCVLYDAKIKQRTLVTVKLLGIGKRVIVADCHSIRWFSVCPLTVTVLERQKSVTVSECHSIQ